LSDADGTDVIRVFVGYRSDGRARFEKLLVRRVADETWELVRSPLLALGVARGDVFRVDADGQITEITTPGGYLSVHAIATSPVAHDGAVVRVMRDVAGRLGGELDSHDDLIVAIAVPKSVTAPELKKTMDAVKGDGFIEDWWVSSVSPLARM
jgi:Domain of unknown function (DUF4265)